MTNNESCYGSYVRKWYENSITYLNATSINLRKHCADLFAFYVLVWKSTSTHYTNFAT